MITREEIGQALDAKDFNPIETCGGHRQGDRAWHVRQIAGVVEALQMGKKFDPIRLNGNGTPADGCHRLYAHWYLKRQWIEVTHEEPRQFLFRCRN